MTDFFGFLPPSADGVAASDTWTDATGSTVTFDGSEWTGGSASQRLVANSQGVWSAAIGGSNRGLSGPALDAVAENDVARVEGPAVWGGEQTGTISAPDPTVTDVAEVEYRAAVTLPGSLDVFRLPVGNGNDLELRFNAGGGVTMRTNAVGFDTGVGSMAAAGITADTPFSIRAHWVSSTGAVVVEWKSGVDFESDAGWLSVGSTTGHETGATFTPGYFRLHRSSASAGLTVLHGAMVRFDGGSVDDVLLTRSDIARSAPDATEIATTSGHTLTVDRATSGPQTLIVPSGAIYVNPDETDTDNKVTTGEGIVAEAVADINGATSSLSFPYVGRALGDVATYWKGLAVDISSGGDDDPYVMGCQGWGGGGFNVRLTDMTWNPGVTFRWYDGSATYGRTLVFVQTVVAGDELELVTTFAGDEGGDHVVRCWLSVNGGPFQLEDTVQTAGVSSIADSAHDFAIGRFHPGSSSSAYRDGAVSGAGVIDDWAVPTARPTIEDFTAKGMYFDRGSLARGAEGATEFPAVTGDTISVNGGGVTFRPTAFSTSGDRVVAEAVAEPAGSSSGLRIAGAGAVAQLYPGGTDLAFIIDHGSAGCPVTPAISMDTFRAFNGNGGGILRYTSAGTLQFITGNGVALSAFSVVGFGSSAAVGRRFTGFEYDESAGQVEAFWSDDGVSWTSVGTGSTTPTTSVTGTAVNFDLLYVGTETWRAPVADLRLIHGSLSDTPVLRLTAGDMARGAEGDTSFPASTGQTVTVLGDVTFRPTLFSGAEPTATFDGVAGTYESVPDAPEFDITGDICVVALVDMDAYTGLSNERTVTGRWVPAGNNQAFLARFATDGRMIWHWSADGIATTGAWSTGHGVTSGRQWFAWSHDVDDGAGGNRVYFWTGGSGAVPEWTTFGNAYNAGTTGLVAATAELAIGAWGDDLDQDPMDGAILHLSVYDGIGDNSAPGLGGTKVFERNQADIARAATAGVGDGESYQSVSGHTVTSHGGVTYTGNAPFVLKGASGVATFDGVAGSYLSVPDEASFDITGDLCIVAKVALDDWTPAAEQSILGKYAEAGNRSYLLWVRQDGGLQLWWSADGSAAFSRSVTTPTGFADGAAGWVASTIEVSTGTIRFWTGGTGDTPVWVQLGSDQVAGATSIFASAANLEVASYYGGLGTQLDGSVEYVALYDGIGANTEPGQGATKVFELTPSDLARNVGESSFDCASGQTVTVNGGVTLSGDVGDDGLLMWAGVVGNPTGAFPELVRVGAFSNSARLRIYRRDTGASNSWQSVDDAGNAAGAFALSIPSDLTAIETLVLHVDRDADLLRGYTFDADGNVATGTYPLNGAGALTISSGITMLGSVPGAMSAALFDAGGTYDATAIEGAASYLLNDYFGGSYIYLDSSRYRVRFGNGTSASLRLGDGSRFEI